MTRNVILLVTIGSLLASFLINDCRANANDLCAIGHPDFNTIVNGNYTYMGTDPDNYGKKYWYRSCADIAVEWGKKYSTSKNYYILKEKNTTGQYGYCSLDDTEPDDCDGYWMIWDGTQYNLDSDFTFNLCSTYTVMFAKTLLFFVQKRFSFPFFKTNTKQNKTIQSQTECMDSDYLDTLPFTRTNKWCVTDVAFNPSIVNGTYKRIGCDEGVPYYELQPSGSGFYLHFDWCYAYWLLGSEISSTSVSAFCNDWEFSSCTGSDNGLYEYTVTDAGPPPVYGFKQDTALTITSCGDPTAAPTDKPTTFPTQPTITPSIVPTEAPATPNPTAPTLGPSELPTLEPSYLPSAYPTKYPTKSDTIDICSFGFDDYEEGEGGIFNSKWSYAGYDSDGVEYWSNDCEGGGYYMKFVSDKYKIIDNDGNNYGSCTGGSDALPYECSGKWRLDGDVISDFYAMDCDELVCVCVCVCLRFESSFDRLLVCLFGLNCSFLLLEVLNLFA